MTQTGSVFVSREGHESLNASVCILLRPFPEVLLDSTPFSDYGLQITGCGTKDR